MRCLFTMFAEDVELLPKGGFRQVLVKCVANPELFPRLVGQLWEAMDTGGFSYALERDVKKFNGYLFKNRTAFKLPREEIGELLEAAKADWRQVEPAIFGTLLEQALNPAERRKLGAHYTPRAYVERLVVATVIEPLREEWISVRSAAEGKRAEGGRKIAATRAGVAGPAEPRPTKSIRCAARFRRRQGAEAALSRGRLGDEWPRCLPGSAMRRAVDAKALARSFRQGADLSRQSPAGYPPWPALAILHGRRRGFALRRWA